MSESSDVPFGTVDVSAAWRSQDRDLLEFRRTLPAAAFGTLIEAARVSLDDGTPLESLTAEQLPLGELADPVAELRTELVSGSGFALVSGFPVDTLTEEETERMFWGIGLRLGRPVSQSVMGERLGHVRDVTKTDPNARAYRNNSELTPHTDPADLLTFLCINPAARGGRSRFVSSMAIHEEIRRSRPDLLQRLYRGYRYHRLGEQQPENPAITQHRVPVFSDRDGFTSCRYVRLYLEVAAEEDPAIELDATDLEALDLFEQLAADPTFHFEFTIKSGEAVFANNFTVLHARSSFENDPTLPPRHLLRLWLATDPPRPLVPNIEHFEGEPGIQPIAGRTPSYETGHDIQ
ncbi:MAG: TauD/TfdA family dioxygenase [Acidimicrobiales bacterium]|nr:TauD/TfdA family dioxygenase [Acidimicrobiales bacterium]